MDKKREDAAKAVEGQRRMADAIIYLWLPPETRRALEIVRARREEKEK